MPLVIVETPKEDKIWGLWKITENYKELWDLLQPPESDRLKLGNIRNDHKKLEFLASRLIIKNILTQMGEIYSGTKNDDFGRPYLAGRDFHISLSHSHDYAAAIVSKEQKVGIDIELIQDKITRITHKYLKEEELSENIQHLTLSWCIKEVMYKLYSERQLSLKDEIHIEALTYEESGYSNASMDPEPLKLYSIKYLTVEEYIIAFNC